MLLQPLPARANFLDDGIDGDLGLLRGQKFGSFKEVEADRLKFRGFPDFDPPPYLDPLSRGIYEEPFRHSMPPSEYTGVVPHVRIHCSRAERVKLYSLLDSSRRIRLYTPDKIRRRHCSGVFGVVKSLEYDRLILDSRPHNVLETPPGRFIQTLGAGHLNVVERARYYFMKHRTAFRGKAVSKKKKRTSLFCLLLSCIVSCFVLLMHVHENISLA